MPALVVANLKIMVRDRQALLWALAFPLILVAVFGVFDIDASGSADLALIDRANDSRSRELRKKLDGIDYLNLVTTYRSQAKAEEALRNGDLEYLLIIPEGMKELSQRSSSDPGNGGGAGEKLTNEPVSLVLYYDVNNELGNQLVIEAIRHFVDDENLRL